jgi:two-component system response regulator AtoC
VAINCGAIPESLLESELFGYVKGAFTDAARDHAGLVEEANGGTLFLDEIGELPLALQVKLLRFLQEEEIRRVGAARGTKVDVRVVAATSRDLAEMVAAGGFREDLFYRLNVLPLSVPPLRDRRDDIPLLVEHFLIEYGERLRRPGMSISREALRALMDYAWPGNIRELENTLERAMVLCDHDRIERESLPDKVLGKRPPLELPFAGEGVKLRDAVGAFEKELIRRTLERTGGNRARAAQILDTPTRTLLHKLKKYDLW